MALNLKNAEAERLVRELADLTGETLTDAVVVSVRERLERERRRRGFDRDRSWARVQAMQRRLAALPLLDGRTADEIVGYDGSGVPR